VNLVGLRDPTQPLQQFVEVISDLLAFSVFDAHAHGEYPRCFFGIGNNAIVFLGLISGGNQVLQRSGNLDMIGSIELDLDLGHILVDFFRFAELVLHEGKPTK